MMSAESRCVGPQRIKKRCALGCQCINRIGNIVRFAIDQWFYCLAFFKAKLTYDEIFCTLLLTRASGAHWTSIWLVWLKLFSATVLADFFRRLRRRFWLKNVAEFFLHLRRQFLLQKCNGTEKFRPPSATILAEKPEKRVCSPPSAAVLAEKCGCFFSPLRGGLGWISAKTWLKKTLHWTRPCANKNT